MSANSARDCLKPVVATLAMLFDVTLRSAVAALRPERARSNDMECGSWGLHDLTDAVQVQRAGIGVQCEVLRRRVDRYAVDGGLQHGIERCRRAVDGRNDLE